MSHQQTNRTEQRRKQNRQGNHPNAKNTNQHLNNEGLGYQARPHANSGQSNNSQGFSSTGNITAEESSSLEKAARLGQDELVAQILEQIETKTSQQQNKKFLNHALHAAVEGCTATKEVENHVSCIHHLVGAGAQINSEKKGRTILMVAASKGYIELISEILSKDAWVNNVDSDSRIALHYAIDNKAENLDVVNLLIEHGSDVNQATINDGHTPLMMAVLRGHKHIVKIFVDLGVRLDAIECNNNNTALHIACLNGEKDIVEMLATEQSFHQIYSKENKDGNQAIDIAEEKVVELQAELVSQNINAPSSSSRSQMQKKDLNDGKESRPHWQIYMYLDNLRSLLAEKANKVGDTLISQEEQDELKRKKKQEKQMELQQQQLLQKQEQQQKEENQQKAIDQAEALKKQIMNNEKKNSQKRNKKEKQDHEQKAPVASEDKAPENEKKRVSPKVESSRQMNRNNSSPSAHASGAPGNSNSGGGRESQQVNNQRSQNQNSGNKKQNQNQEHLNMDQNSNQLAPLVTQLMQQQESAASALASQQPPPPAASTQPQPPMPPYLQHAGLMQQAPNGIANHGMLGGVGGLNQPGQLQHQQEYPQNLVGGIQQQQYGALGLPGGLPGGLQQLDPNALAGLQNLALSGLNPLPGMVGLNLGQGLSAQNQNPVDLQNIQGQPLGSQHFGNLGQPQQFPQGLSGAGGIGGVQQNLHAQQLAQQLPGLNMSSAGGAGGANLQNHVGQYLSPSPQQFQAQLNPNVNQHSLHASLQALQNQSQMPNFVGSSQTHQNIQNGQQTQNGSGQLGQGNLVQQQQQNITNDLINQNSGSGAAQPGQVGQTAAQAQQAFNNQQLQPGLQSQQNKNGLNNISIPATAMPSVSAASNPSLPIRVNLDFSDEKSQNLFIFEQKYNMKKNDCFNLEKQKLALQQQLANRNSECEKLRASLQALQLKYQEQAQANEVGGTTNNSSNTAQSTQQLESKIADLEESHNEQLTMINRYKLMSEEKTKFSLEVINKSMLAVDLIRRYKTEGSNNARGAGEDDVPSKEEVDGVEERIIACQEAIQKDLIPTDPSTMVTNPLSLQFLKNGSRQGAMANSAGAGRPGSTRALANLQFFNQSHNYENQASNILEMEKRYETPLKQPPMTSNASGGGAGQPRGGQVLMQTGHGMQLVHQPQLSGQTTNGQGGDVVQVHTRHNFFEIQNILHNEILLFKQDANAILKEMQQVKAILIQKLTQVVTRLYQNYFVDVYGSHATGLCLHWSDIDLVVGPRANSDGEKEQPINATMQDARIKDALRRIADCLRGEMANQWITHVHYIDQATVPVVKIQCSLSALMASAGHKYPKNAKYAAIYDERFSLDITHMTEGHNGIQCVNLVKEYLLDCWFIEPLILVLKQMLKVNGLNDPYKGGLSSYGLLLMIVAFIQFRKLNKVRVPQNINLGHILLDFLHYYGEILQYHEYGIMCRKPGDPNESNNFYHLLPSRDSIELMYRATTVPCIDDPLNPQNNVGKSSFQFQDIQKIFKVGYQSAFLGCFCDCHFQAYNNSDSSLSNQDPTNASMSLRSQPFVHGQRFHPVFNPAQGEQVPDIIYQDDQGNQQFARVEDLYENERIPASDKCDSILTKIIYSQAQFKAAEQNAM